MRAIGRLFALLLGCLPLVAVAAADGAPRVGLVLSGGGARGIAHVGVLKVLEEMRVPVHAIAGTSMGAIVGGLYASGMSPTEIEQLVSTLDWQDSFRDRPPRRALDFRRKQDDREFLVRLPLGIKGGDFTLPRGLIQGQKLNQVLRGRTLHVADVEDFDRLPIRYRAVAADIETGETVVLSRGDLASAMRASMSAPGVFAPVERDGRVLVDGGIATNLPVDVARSMGVDVLIVVDVSSQPLPSGQLQSALAVSNQMIALMISRETQRQRALLGAQDVLIEPPLGALGSTDFFRAPRTVAAGEQATRELAARLAPLAVDDVEWQRYLAARGMPVAPAPRIDFVRSDAGSSRYAKVIEATMAPLVGKPLDPGTLERGMSRLYGDDVLERLDYRLVRDGDRAGLEFTARRKSWGPNYVRFGLDLQDDFQGENSFNAGIRFLVTELNSYGAEWITDLQIGENPRVFSEFYQPLGYQTRWFVAPRVLFESRPLSLIEQGERIGEYRVRNTEVGLDFGRELSNWGEARVGAFRRSGSQRLRVGTPQEPRIPADASFDLGGWFARFSIDKLDSVYFPREGNQLTLEWTAGREGVGADFDYDVARAEWLYATSRGRHTYLFSAGTGTAVSGPENALADYYSLGGLFNLSGLSPDTLSGRHFAIARGVWYKRVGSGGEGFLNVPTYAGVSLELGNVWDRRGDISVGGSRFNSAMFLGLDTYLGPLYLAAGFDEDGESSYYLLLGRSF